MRSLCLNICTHDQGDDAVRVSREDSSGAVVLVLALALFCADQPAISEDLHFQIAYRRQVSAVRSGALLHAAAANAAEQHAIVDTH